MKRSPRAKRRKLHKSRRRREKILFADGEGYASTPSVSSGISIKLVLPEAIVSQQHDPNTVIPEVLLITLMYRM